MKSKSKIGLLRIGLLLILVIACVQVVSASSRIVNAGGTVFIGETDLDITNCVSGDIIGWWDSATPLSNRPDKINFIYSKTSFMVVPSSFSGLTGPWYNLNSGGTAGDVAFFVEDPNPPPVAAFEATPLSGPVPLKVTFTDKSTGDGITSRIWQYKLKSDSTWITFYRWTPKSRDNSPEIKFLVPGIYEVKLTVIGTGGTGEAQKDIGAGCDSSTQRNIERCFGGVGVQCEGVPFFAPMHLKEKTCYVKGWMSTGSILHDQCCLSSGNTGVGCAHPDGSNKCQAAWGEALLDTYCGEKAKRQWQIEFGPYFMGNSGDLKDVPQALLRAPHNTRINPAYEYLCISGKCKVDKKTGMTRLYSDKCSAYCICE